MDNQKDTKRTDLDSYGHSNVPDIKSLLNKPVYKYVSKKTEKLVTALYMVTDYMDSEDALKEKIRYLGVELLSDMYKLSGWSLVDNQTHISSTLLRLHEIASLIDISSTIGYISDMNSTILKKELNLLILQLQPKDSKDNPFAFTIDEKMFEVEPPIRPENILENRVIKDKRTSLSMSFINRNNSQMSVIKRSLSSNFHSMTKEERTNKILNIIKDKKDLSIKDISIAFTDFSEKTIQRELNSLVAKGQIRKVGAKRWSRYQSL